MSATGAFVPEADNYKISGTQKARGKQGRILGGGGGGGGVIRSKAPNNRGTNCQIEA